MQQPYIFEFLDIMKCWRQTHKHTHRSIYQLASCH